MRLGAWRATAMSMYREMKMTFWLEKAEEALVERK